MDNREIIGYSAAELPAALNLMESTMEMGEKACLAICSEALPTEDELDDFHLGMLAGGFHASRPTARVIEGVPTTEFVLQKGSPQWLLLIPMIPTILIVGLITFGIIRIEAITKALLPLLITGAVCLVALAVIVRKPALKYIEAGVSKKALAAS